MDEAKQIINFALSIPNTSTRHIIIHYNSRNSNVTIWVHSLINRAVLACYDYGKYFMNYDNIMNKLKDLKERMEAENASRKETNSE